MDILGIVGLALVAISGVGAILTFILSYLGLLDGKPKETRILEKVDYISNQGGVIGDYIDLDIHDFDALLIPISTKSVDEGKNNLGK